MKIPLFDNDGTLLIGGSANRVHHKAFDEALHTVYGLADASVAEITISGKVDSQIILEVALLHGFPEEEALALLPQAFTVMSQYFSEHKHEGMPQAEKGAKELLQLLQGKTHIGVLTGNIESIGWEKLTQAGLREFIEFGSFGNLALRRVALINIAQHRYEQQFKEKRPLTDFVSIGDTPRDIASAREGGIQVIAVATGHYTKEELKEADLVVETLEEQQEILNFLS